MYEKNGEKYFVVDSHMHYWNAAPDNWVPGAEQYAKGWIECFHAYQGLGPPQTRWTLEHFQKYSEDDLMKDVFENGYVDVAIFQPTYLQEWYAEGVNTNERNAALGERQPGMSIANTRFDPRDGDHGLGDRRRHAARRRRLQPVHRTALQRRRREDLRMQPGRRASRPMRKWLVIAVGLAAIVAAVVLISRGGGEGSYLVRAVFDNASFMVKGEQVRGAGAHVGKISSVDVTMPGEGDSYSHGRPRAVPGKAAIVMEIADPGFREDYARQLSKAVTAWSAPKAWEGTRSVMGDATPAADVGAMLLMETALHGWDVARATAWRVLRTTSDPVASRLPHPPRLSEARPAGPPGSR